jgi:hypothetical protein
MMAPSGEREKERPAQEHESPPGGTSMAAAQNPASDGFDPAVDLPSDEPEIREVTDPADRATGTRVTNSSEWKNATVVAAFSKPLIDERGDQFTPTSGELARELKARIAQVNNGSLAEVEAMLLGQAHSLEAIYMHFALRALSAPSLPYQEQYLAISFKAQAQSRATLTAVADTKNPRQPRFIAQQNLALNQQINNSAVPSSEATEANNPRIKLLETERGERMDIAATSSPSGAHQALETVGEIKWAENREG